MSINEEAGVANVAGKVVGAVVKFFRGGKDESKPDPQTLNLLKALKSLWQVFNTEKGALEIGSEMDKFLDNAIKTDAESTRDYNRYQSNLDKIYAVVKKSGVVKEGVHELLGKNEQIGKAIAAIYNITKTKLNGDFAEYPGVVGEKWDEFCDEIGKFNSTMQKAIEAVPELTNLKPGDMVSWTSETGNTITKEIIRVEGGKLVFKDKKGQEYTKNAKGVKLAPNKEAEPAKESTLNSYSKFLKLLEADEPEKTQGQAQATQGQAQATQGQAQATQGEATTDKPTPNTQTQDTLDAPEGGTVSEKIKIFFDKNCKTVRNYVLDRTEFSKMSAEVDKLIQTNNMVIDGLDPVIQIVRLFNRAYRIYMTNTITMRSGGKVDPMTFNEYEAFGGRSGGGDLNGWAGPFRNIKIFRQWEDAVLKIMGDRKYQALFSPKTRMRFAKKTNPQGPEDFEYRDGAGAKLRTFITDILDGQDLYRTSDTRSEERGAQSAFLEKYFGKIPDSEDVKDFTITPEEAEHNGPIAEATAKSAKKLTFKRLKAEPKAEDIRVNSFLVITCDVLDKKGKVVKENSKRYVKVEGPKSIMFSNTFYYFDLMLKRAPNQEPKDASTRKVEKGEVDILGVSPTDTESKWYQMKYAKSRGKTLYDLLRKGKSIKLKYVTGNDKDNTLEESIKIIDIYWLTQNVDNKDVIYEGNWDRDWEKKSINSKIQTNTNAQVIFADIQLNKNNTDIIPL